MQSTRQKNPFSGKVEFQSSSKINLREKSKSHYRRIAKKESTRRKVHSTENDAYLDCRVLLPSAARLRHQLRGGSRMILQKITLPTGTFYSGHWKGKLLELSYNKGFQVFLRSPLTMKIERARYGKKRNPTLSNLLGREVQFVYSSPDLLVFDVLFENSMPVTPLAPAHYETKNLLGNKNSRGTLPEKTLVARQTEFVSDSSYVYPKE